MNQSSLTGSSSCNPHSWESVVKSINKPMNYLPYPYLVSRCINCTDEMTLNEQWTPSTCNHVCVTCWLMTGTRRVLYADEHSAAGISRPHRELSQNSMKEREIPARLTNIWIIWFLLCQTCYLKLTRLYTSGYLTTTYQLLRSLYIPRYIHIYIYIYARFTA